MKNNRLTNLQIELLKSVQYIASDEQVAEIKSLLRFYFLQKLENAVSAAESQKNYSAEIYGQWLHAKATDSATGFAI